MVWISPKNIVLCGAGNCPLFFEESKQMKKSLLESWHGMMRLVHFLTWYGAAVSAIFYLMPIAGHFVEIQYEILSSSTRFFSVIGFFAVVSAWHVLSNRDRWQLAA
jgi:hypothetical protein